MTWPALPLTLPTPVAFFDLDKTLIDDDAGVLFGAHLLALARAEVQAATGAARRRLRWRYRLFVGEVVAKALVARSLHAARLMKRSQVVRTAYTFFAGIERTRLERDLDRFFAGTLAERVYPEVKRVLAWHRAQGHVTVLVTTGMRPIAERYARLLGIGRVIACELEDEDGILTGRVRGPLYGEDKAREVERLAAEHDWDLARSYAYTDHYSDRPLLEAVGNPRPVHPDARLRRLARRRRWPLLDFSDPARAVVPTRSDEDGRPTAR